MTVLNAEIAGPNPTLGVSSFHLLRKGVGTEMIHPAKSGPPKVRQSLCQLVTFDSGKRGTIKCLQIKDRTLSPARSSHVGKHCPNTVLPTTWQYDCAHSDRSLITEPATA